MSLPAQTDPHRVSAVDLDETDRRILNAMQPEFPLCRSPYKKIAEQAGLSEREAVERVRSLRRRGVIRRIGGVLNSHKLGLVSTLVAMRVPPARVEEVAAIVNALPNVTHNYLRDYEYNMWFTLTANSPEALAELIAQVRQSTQIEEILDLPSVRTYKINVQMDFSQ